MKHYIDMPGELRKTPKIFIRIASVLAKIQTEHLPNTVLNAITFGIIILNDSDNIFSDCLFLLLPLGAKRMCETLHFTSVS
jgi:hypothetical protein